MGQGSLALLTLDFWTFSVEHDYSTEGRCGDAGSDGLRGRAVLSLLMTGSTWRSLLLTDPDWSVLRTSTLQLCETGSSFGGPMAPICATLGYLEPSKLICLISKMSIAVPASWWLVRIK